MNSTKSMIGHLLGGAGSVEAVATIMALQTSEFRDCALGIWGLGILGFCGLGVKGFWVGDLTSLSPVLEIPVCTLHTTPFALKECGNVSGFRLLGSARDFIVSGMLRLVQG